jgi:geranylgeranyl diphosphate synthase type I
MLQDVLTTTQRLLKPYLRNFLIQRRTSVSKVNQWGDDVMDRLEGFAGQGKMLRGGLVIEAARMFGRETDEAVLAAGAAMELVHASLLIHDDIMDRDVLRRGQPTMWAQYQRLGETQGVDRSTDFGQAMAMCVGDLGFFMAVQLLSQTQDKAAAMVHVFGRELPPCCYAQMEDVALSLSTAEPSKEQILSVYKYKTARYTFSLPLAVGAILAGADEILVEQLENFGEQLGILFQIKDDELGLFGDEAEIGKPVGSDVIENKKTLLRYYLFTLANPSQRQELGLVFGHDLSVEQLDWVRELVRELGIDVLITTQVDELIAECQLLIDQLDVAAEHKQFFSQLVEYTINRSK